VLSILECFKSNTDVGGICFLGQIVVLGSGCGPLLSESIPELKSLVYVMKIVCNAWCLLDCHSFGPWIWYCFGFVVVGLARWIIRGC